MMYDLHEYRKVSYNSELTVKDARNCDLVIKDRLSLSRNQEHKIIKRRRLKKVAWRLIAPQRALSAGCHASPPGRPIEGAKRQPSSAMFTKTLCMKWRLLIQGSNDNIY
ncbi:hypothetical protein LR48_Vigan10g171600 [Vigna angularis]|uniref:Uncharacterized protein n=1 Tax=Phaseolus angularis TaxID=3914 RepID=A0A0L9VM49_PHAAN|nr:hypothetical protein LR48_Vigan10g171600 [Vigna angularis]